MANLALIGSGNILFCDEGIGLYASEYIKSNYSFTPPIDIYDGGVLGMRFMEIVAEYDNLIIANTSSSKTHAIGDIEHISHDELLEQNHIHKTANELEIAQMLQSCVMMDRCAAVEMISVVAEDIMSVKIALTDSMIEAFDNYIAEIINSIKKHNISVSYNHRLSLAEIIAKNL